MSETEDKIVGLFEKRLKNWAPEPPQGVWEAVLASQQRRRRIILYRVAAIAATILLLVSLPFLIHHQNPEELPSKQAASATLSNPETFPQTSTEKPYFDNDFEKYAKNHGPVIRSFTQSPGLEKEQITALVEDEEPIAEEILLDNNVILSDEAVAQAVDNPKEIQQAVEEMLAKLKEEEEGKSNDLNSSERNKPSLAVAYNFAPVAITGENGLFNNILNYRFGPDPFQGNMAIETRYYRDVEKSRLEAPFSAGLKFSFPVSKRLAFETGLTYTRLNTYTKTFPLDGVHIEYNQSIVYLGVPLGMRYDVLQTRLLSIYAAQNLMAEKGITAINSINKFEKDRNIGRIKLYENVQGFQLSTTTSAGVGLNLHRYISFYGEGGLQIYYFNHTQPFNIRSSKKLWPVYQSGIRVNF